MKRIDLYLIPSPGDKAEFVATLQPASSSSSSVSSWQTNLPSKVTLEGYTREGWAWKPNSKAWDVVQVRSVDGRRKLPSFLSYLKERKKSAFGRYGRTKVFVITYIQRSRPGDGDDGIMECKFSSDTTQIPGCPFGRNSKTVERPTDMQQKHAAKEKQKREKQQQPPVRSISTGNNTSGGSSGGSSSKRGGFLGNLLGAQKRTNVHLNNAPVKKAKGLEGGGNIVGNNSETADDGGERKTAQQVITDFRNQMEQKMLDFDIDEHSNVLRVNISLAEVTRGLDEEGKGRVTMETLKFMVIEQAEEVNEEWVAHKEPSEFMDEVTMAVYKEGHVPDEVLEEVNRVELTEDMRGQQRAIQEARRREVQKKEREIDEQNKALLSVGGGGKNDTNDGDDSDLAALNTKKRDLRTIEQIQRDRDREHQS